MFISASLDFKVHSSTPDGVENHQVQHPPSTSKIVNVSICNDNSYIAVLRENEKPQIFSAKDRQNVRLIHTINVSNVSALAFKHNTKKNIAMGTMGGDVVMYDTKGRNLSKVYPKITENVKALDFTCDDQQLCGYDGNVMFVFPDITNSNHVRKYKQLSKCTALKCHPFIPNRVAVGCVSGRVGLWDVQTGQEMLNLELLQSPIRGISMSSCGNFLVVAGKVLKVCGIDYSSSNCTFQYNLEVERQVSSLDLSPDDKFLAVGLEDGTLKLYDVKQQLKQIYSSKLHHSSINIIVFENKAKEINTNFSSVMLLTDNNIKEDEPVEIPQRPDSPKDEKTTKVEKVEHKDDSLEKMKKSLLKVIKNEMDCLENQLNEHCVKFQKFLDNEFETIDAIIKKKWDIFNVGDMNQIIKAICPDDGKSYPE